LLKDKLTFQWVVLVLPATPWTLFKG
jgi:hypothetical protein